MDSGVECYDKNGLDSVNGDTIACQFFPRLPFILLFPFMLFPFR